MEKEKRKPKKSDIYMLYDLYSSYKQYYEYYWEHINLHNITEEDINERMSEIFSSGEKLGGVIDAVCFYANIPKNELFNKDGTPKDINELDTLKMIKEANYGKIND